MRKVFVLLSVVALIALAFESATFVLERNRIQNLCLSGHSRIETAHDAIDVMRNYRDGSYLVGKVLSRARQFDAFQNDGYATSRTDDGSTRGGGWLVEEWNTPLITRGYTVTFEYYAPEFRPEIEVKCDVLECGAIDISNCRTLGAFYS